MNEIKFSHLVEIDESRRMLVIFRVFPNGDKQLYTEVEFPSRPMDGASVAYESLFRSLGENLLLDSPVARRIMGA